MIEALQKKTDQVDGFYQALKKQEKTLSTELTGLKKDVELLTKTSTVLKHLLDTMVKDEISRMAGLITYGLKAVFDDQDLTFIPKIVKKNEKLHIELKTSNQGIEGAFGSFGGSVAVIESILLRILCLLKKKLARLMLLDETLAPISKEYIPNTSKLLNELSKKLNMDILLVTQERDFQDYVDHVYFVKKSPNGIIMEKVK